VRSYQKILRPLLACPTLTETMLLRVRYSETRERSPMRTKAWSKKTDTTRCACMRRRALHLAFAISYACKSRLCLNVARITIGSSAYFHPFRIQERRF